MDNIFGALRAAANAESAAKMSAYMRGQFPFLGLPTPERRKLSREFLKDKSKSAPDWVRGFVERHKDSLAPLSIREASKYI
jgi:3-methyladenine DNA glycosylase AlkD